MTNWTSEAPAITGYHWFKGRFREKVNQWRDRTFLVYYCAESQEIFIIGLKVFYSLKDFEGLVWPGSFIKAAEHTMV